MSKPNELYGRPWSEPEYLLALDLYFDLRDQPRNKDDDAIQELARLTGRTPAAILMRMENFASLDLDNNGERRGLGHMPALGKKIFEEWLPKITNLKDCAGVLRRQAERNWSERRTLFDPDPISIPKAFGKYELLDCVGRGGFGSVYSCINVETEEVKALKIIHLERKYDHEAFHRFRREIRALKQVEAPNVVKICEDNLDAEDEFPAFTMDLAVSNLTDYANSVYAIKGIRPILELEESVSVIRHMMSAIGTLHSCHPKIVHRDINPNNILQMSNGSWVLADFGLVKFIGTAALSTTFETKTTRGPGTAYYTAPEQYKDFKRTDERVGIYSLGILLWELFTNSVPYPDPRNSGLCPELEEIFVKATERDPQDRYTTLQEFHDAFEATDLAQSVSA